MEMVGDSHRSDARVRGELRLSRQGLRVVLLARQEISDFHHHVTSGSTVTAYPLSGYLIHPERGGRIKRIRRALYLAGKGTAGLRGSAGRSPACLEHRSR